MSKHEGTFHQLLAMRKEIMDYSKNSITFCLFNREKIANFQKYNSLTLQLADEKLGRLIKKFVQHDEQDNPIKEEVDGFAKYKFNNADDEKAFHIDYNEFLKRTVKIEW